MNDDDLNDEFGIPPLYDGHPERPKRGNGKDPPRFPLVKFRDAALTTTSFYCVKGLIPASGLVVIYGPPKCGKSFWVFDLLMHVARGETYRGLRVNAGPIVYCALEGGKGFIRRIEAERRNHPQEANDPPFFFMFYALDLIADQKALIASIRAQMPDGEPPAVVAIDTLNRSLFGSESSDEDMSAYVRAADAVRDAFECAVLIIHHCGHNADRPRGHSSLLGAADVLISVKRDDAGNIVVTVEESKDGERGMVIMSRLAVKELGDDDDGDQMTSCVIEAVGELGDAPKASAKPKTLTKTARLALRALHMAIGELGEAQASTYVPPGMKAVTVEQWRSFAYKTGICTSDNPHSKGAAFNRGSEALLDANKIGIWEPYVWPIFQVKK